MTKIKKKAARLPASPKKNTDLFSLGFAHYQAGRLNEAESCCRALLATDHHHPDTLHLLGMILHQAGDNPNAIDFIKKAIAVVPDNFFYHLNLGNIYFSVKKHAKAEDCYRKALELNPNFIPTMLHLAENLEQSHRHQDALVYYRKALTIEPDNPLVLAGLGNTLLAAGMIEESIVTLHKLVKAAPNRAESYYNLGGALMRLGDIGRAAEQFRQSLKLRPDFVEAYYNLGLTMKSLQEPDQPLSKSIAFYKKALSLEPNHPVALTGLGNALLAKGMAKEAIVIFRQLVRTSPDIADSPYSLGLALKSFGDIEGAAEQYKKSLQLRPDFVEAHLALGLTYEYLGQQSEAINIYRQAIKIRPSFSMSHCQLAQIKKHKSIDDDIVAMENIYNSEKLNSYDRMILGYGLGKAYEEIKSYDKAFAFFEEANNLKRATYEYSLSAENADLERIKQFFTRSLFKRLANAGTNGEGAIFVLGMPRSGTSLVEHILASHSSVFGAGELPTLHDMLADHSKPPAPFIDYASLTKVVQDLEEMGRKYLTITRSLNKGKETKYIVDKMPHNFLHIGMIKLMLPEAKVVHCRRHPMDNCLSIYKNFFQNRGHFYAYNQKELGNYYQLYHKLMEHWHLVLPGFIHDICYEDLVADQEKQSRSLFEFCGIPWDSNSLTFHKTNRTVTTLSSSQVRRPIYKDSVKLWEKYGDRLKDLADALKEDI
jgi:tetratricopeptide (TPR) repeat protein